MMIATTVTVRQILEQKGSVTHAVAPDVSVLDALSVMARHDIGSVLVTQNDRLAGIFTERDYARKLVLKGLNSKDATVSDVMTPNVCTITPSQTLDQVMNIMTENRFRHLPVVDHGKIVGIVTIGDVVKAVIDQQEKTINHLSSYIAGDLAT
jgi:CBS domain-containing protein